MHQQPRHPPRSASAATNPQTNPTRTNNPRDTNHNMSPTEHSPYPNRDDDEDIRSDETGDRLSENEKKDLTRVRQVIQQFFNKAALLIVSARAVLPQSMNQDGNVKQNKWFNIVVDDTDALSESLADWKGLDILNELPPRLCIETYVDLKDLGNKQILVANDDRGKRWNVGEMLNQPMSPHSPLPKRNERVTQLLLERWIVEVKDKETASPASLRDPLPNVYKKAVVLFRSLFTVTHMLPAYKYFKRQAGAHGGLKLRYRISNDIFKHPRRDTLHIPLYETSEPVVETQTFAPSNSPIGPLSISVVFRVDCDLRVDDQESLLSSQFMGLDDNYFKPSLGHAGNEQSAVPGSLPVNRANQQDQPDRSQAYGSMSTFHQVGPAGSSPISALRAVRDQPSRSPVEASPREPTTLHPGPERRSSLRAGGVGTRRPSVSFQAFKAGSLSSSPAIGTPVLHSPSSSVGRGTSAAPYTQPRNRTSLTALPQTALRTPSLPNETAIASSASGSPKPAPINRYSSSFGHRRSKFSSGGGSKTEDDNISSGKASVSSAQPGSSMMNEGEGGSSGSMQTDDENISDFLKLLDSKKDLRSFNRRDSASRDAAMRRTTAALSTYQKMRDSNAVLSDSMSSSLLLHRSSSSSSRQLSSVPPMIAGTSVSTSSSPGKPISPHTPHTPAIPSRLSANSVADYDQPHRSRSRGRVIPRPINPSTSRPEEEADPPPGASEAIDIPTSPRAWPYIRRSSSAAQQQRTLEDDADIYGLRSASVPAEEGPHLSLSELLQHHESSPAAAHQASADASDERTVPRNVVLPTSQDGETEHRTGPALRSRGSYTRGVTTRSSRYSFSSRAGHALDDDEPLLFDMSEIGNATRRSVEEGRGGTASGTAGLDRRRGGSTTRSPWL
ncbi:hypothetical protein EJ05DRAFT_113861 [Pseudovirgaria hyperparasitica]|uniref:Autophagy-related protein 13 n=1 Tax=Pseudovirgaria hyperparasitica TaxID=470096 RepID=A0A6A6VYM8_9PEZI|nr:uncharacterized protein EJ05DRAFT_113861 [Pseudovirgaria hyperparasitica]KAF2755742.1 hypothetical protein EJ05DRAFT_113861 [Pseudovirgaria hyperparasitica]